MVSQKDLDLSFEYPIVESTFPDASNFDVDIFVDDTFISLQ